MTIFLYELKKIFRPRLLFFAVAISALVLFFAFFLVIGSEMNPYRVDGTEPFYYAPNGQTIGRTAEFYRVFDRFAEKYGTKIDDEVIRKTESLEYPELDKYISEDPDFRLLGVKNSCEYAEMLDKYGTVSELDVRSACNGYSFPMDELTDEEINSFSDLLFKADDNLSSHYVNQFIKQNELFRKYGIESQYELYYTENGLSETAMNELSYELGRNLPINSRTPVPEIEKLHTELSRFIFCYRLRRLYEEAKTDPIHLYVDDTGYYSYSRQHRTIR